jgi:hypothetical protein
MTAADLIGLAPIGGGFLAFAYLVVKAGPGWNTSLVKQAREDAASQSKRRQDAEAAAEAARVEAIRESRRAERYRVLLVRAGINPNDPDDEPERDVTP